MNRFSVVPLLLLPLVLGSCGLLMAPVRVGAGVVRGTAQLTEAAVTAPVDAHRKRKERKKAKKEKEAEEAPNDGDGAASPEPLLPVTDESLPPVDGELPTLEPDLPPLPQEYDLPPP